MKKTTFLKLSAGFLITSAVLLINGCGKDKINSENQKVKDLVATVVPAVQDKPLTMVMTIAAIRKSDDGTSYNVMFNRNAEVFTVRDETMIASFRQAMTSKSPVKIVFNPWEASIVEFSVPSAQEVSNINTKQLVSSPGVAMNIDLDKMNKEDLDKMQRIAVINRTTPGLTNFVPDMATAQLMFDYISKQCCAIPGPYSIDYCISFQYAEDGCYARAQKMCAIINQRYHYDTHKIFSFANAGSDVLSVKANKWGGCCVNWWYHVAPLVNIKTPGGTKAYVFDPAMFDQPVLLATWLHFQQNPACGSVAHVSMINIQPTVSYSPADYTGYAFDTDPTSSSTDATLSYYSGLTTCP